MLLKHCRPFGCTTNLAMVKGHLVDALDRSVIQALQLDGRISSSALARTLDVSNRTVDRRVSLLRSMGVVRVVGALDATALGRSQWIIRIRVVPGAAAPVAQALAERPDTTWVRILAGGTDVVCMLQESSRATSVNDLVDTLPRASSVVDVTAQLQLHVYRRGTRSLPYLAGALSPEQFRAVEFGAVPRAAQPAAHGPRSAAASPGLDDVDRALLSLLHQDGRARLEALAAATGRPASTVRRRVARLRASSILRLDVEVDHRALGRPMLTHLWMAVVPGELHRAGAALARHPEVAFAAATTGRTNLYACVLAADAADLHKYLIGRLASIVPLRAVEAIPVAVHLKGAGAAGRRPRQRWPHSDQEAAVSAAKSR